MIYSVEKESDFGSNLESSALLESITDLRSSVPLLELALFALATISLWMFDPAGWTLAGFDGSNLGADPGYLTSV